MGLLNRFSGGNPAVHAKIEAMWKEALQDEQFRERSPVSPELMQYAGEAIRAAYLAGKLAYPNPRG
jgi:hypothetical protein